MRLMRLALVSDLHGNELALERVLADATRTGFDRLVCLGDVATLGPRPKAVLDRLRDLGCECILGNHDEFMPDPGLVRSYSEHQIIVDSVDATRDTLAPDDIEFIRSFQRTVAYDDVLLYHGTPRSNMEDLLVDTPAEDVDEMLAGNRATVLAGGHTHLQMVRQHKGMLIVNPGSLGQPFREYANGGPPVILSHAEYCIVDVRKDGASVDMRRVNLSPSDLSAQVNGWDNPLAASLKGAYV
jgi:putative phosphoesterase